jgi:multidrug efflux system membrane fusion protein
VRPVKLGVSQGEKVAVTSGLQPGDRVVVDGADKLRDGAKVTLHDAREEAPAPAPGAGQRQRRGRQG